MRAVKLITGAGEQRFTGIALDELESAGEGLAALKLTRALEVSSTGLPMDVTVTELCDAVLDGDEAEPLENVIASLPTAIDHLGDAKRRIRHVVACAMQTNTRRIAVASALSNA